MAKISDSRKEKNKVQRIKAIDTAEKKPITKKTEKTKVSKLSNSKTFREAKKTASEKKPRRGIFGRSFGYLKGSWYELKQVHWPSKSATWSMTAAVLLFSLLFAVLIILLDLGFDWVFKQLLS